MWYSSRLDRVVELFLRSYSFKAPSDIFLILGEPANYETAKNEGLIHSGNWDQSITCHLTDFIMSPIGFLQT